MAPTATRLPAQAARAMQAVSPVQGVVDDWTNWERFREKVVQYSITTLDAALWTCINTTVLFIMAFVGVVSYLFIEPIIKTFAPYFTKPFKFQKGSTTVAIQPSLISSSTPDFFPAYTRYLSSGGWETLGPKLADARNMNEPVWDGDVARFMIHLSALSYEHPDVVVNFATQWRLETVKILRKSFACHIFYSSQYKFATVCFKGTSPFDLSEVLTDLMMMKVRPDGGVIPGQVHEGFYNTFQWDSPTRKDEAWARKHQCEVDAIFNLLRSTVITRLGSGASIWVTGHSLGGALATVFLSHMTYLAQSPLTNSARLRAAYVFGSPRVGDSTFANITNASVAASKATCFRIVNANDLVPTLPLSSNIPFSTYKYAQAVSHGKSPNMVTDFEHVGTPVLVGYDGIVRMNAERNWALAGKNVFGWAIEWPRFLFDVVRRRETLASLVGRNLMLFPYDHSPAEYNRHLAPKVK
ncbi:hypothetical protein SmJEL517_g01841 [Synchytrium microbalum]|uniref:Fungal lipase-type domain-containing protein n=1 Tax=Synchytrium microbalum TaxID=1806994 RepID=A0A507CDA5_9FUNG|nr:uncharacterized protein SmJEL517_g01841 [Synchytrium microbalum]TPX35904.1 hypothetical protein SmJEL517_g01841 [Synchytrium microbalum]